MLFGVHFYLLIEMNLAKKAAAFVYDSKSSLILKSKSNEPQKK